MKCQSLIKHVYVERVRQNDMYTQDEEKKKKKKTSYCLRVSSFILTTTEHMQVTYTRSEFDPAKHRMRMRVMQRVREAEL